MQKVKGRRGNCASLMVLCCSHRRWKNKAEKKQRGIKPHQCWAKETESMECRLPCSGKADGLFWAFALFFFFSKAFSLSGRQLQWASRTVSSNSWEMKGACAPEKPISSKACACCSSGEGDVITEMSPVWCFTVGGRGDTDPQKAHKELCWQRLKELVHKQ